MAAEDPTLRRIEVLLERDLDATGLLRAEALVEEAAALIRGYLPALTLVLYPTFDELPEEVRHVAASMVARVLATPAERTGVESTGETAGPFGQTLRFSSASTSGGPWLSATDKLRLRPFGTGRTGSVGVVSERTL